MGGEDLHGGMVRFERHHLRARFAPRALAEDRAGDLISSATL